MHPNTPARELYKKLGFQQCGYYPQAYRQPDGTYTDDISMYLDLTAGS